MIIPPLSTTAIGSLPHTTVDEAIDRAFSVDFPFLPQLPMKDPREFMLPAATEGVPGIVRDEAGMITLDLAAWKKGRAKYDDLLLDALEKDKIDGFLPSESFAAALTPFLRRLRDSGAKQAKVQIAGPLTVQWTLRTTEGHVPPAPALTQVSRTILARSLALAKAVAETGAEPMLFFDEPGLYAFSRQQPGHIVMLQELRINTMALRKYGAKVGLHCCSDADWGALLGVGLDVLAIDAKLSLRSLLKAGETLVTFVNMGGRLALGVIPTNQGEMEPVDVLFGRLTEHLSTLEQYFPTRASIMENILGRSLLTPACGLALLTPGEADRVLEQLRAFQRAYRTARS